MLLLDKYEKVTFDRMGLKEKEVYNYYSFAVKLAEYGFQLVPVHNDWKGADLIAISKHQTDLLKIQLKGSFYLDRNFIGRDIFIAFVYENEYYLYPHDDIYSKFKYKLTDKKWIKNGTYFSTKLTKEIRSFLEEYRIL